MDIDKKSKDYQEGFIDGLKMMGSQITLISDYLESQRQKNKPINVDMLLKVIQTTFKKYKPVSDELHSPEAL